MSVSVYLISLLSISLCRVSCTFLLVDLEEDPAVDGSNQKVATDVEGSDTVQNERIIERDLLGDLHHSKNDDQVGTVKRKASLARRPYRRNIEARSGETTRLTPED